MELSKRLVVLYQEMADLTAPECAHSCRAPHSCCDAMYCELTRQYALERYGITLTPAEPCDNNPKQLPFIGPQGCVVAPHLRPLCTVHTCAINGLGFKIGDEKWTREYYRLRNLLSRIDGQV